MQMFPSLVQQPGWILGVADAMALSMVGPYAQVDEARLVVPTRPPNPAKAAVIHAVDEWTTPAVGRFTLTNGRTGFTESYTRRAAGRR